MKPVRIFSFLVTLAFACAFAVRGSGATTFQKNTAYFNNEYGLEESSEIVTSYQFLHPSFGFTELVEEFSVRKYKRRELEIEAVFRRRDMKLFAVTFRRPRVWEEGELASQLAGFGSRWRRLSDWDYNFVSGEGVRASYQARTLYMVSALALGTIEQREEERRKAEEKKS
ncbi:MAG TPA: hypothetical protein VFJ90_08555 [Candidatus Didemnitutus sp.]|nr:hypothetical protein [Candidatus Didemnitutus sp.]